MAGQLSEQLILRLPGFSMRNSHSSPSPPSRSGILLRILKTPWRVLGLVLLVVFAVEAAVMICLPLFVPTGISDTLAAFIDAALLTLICAPAIWWIIVAPLRRIALEAHALSSTIVENAGDGIITTSSTGLILSFNPAACELFGHETATALGRPITSLLPNLHLDTTSVGESVSTHAKRKSGGDFPASVSVRRLGDEEDSANVIVIRDLTEAIRAEEERTIAVRREEAQRAQQMATLAQLATGVAHEIRNPLTAIKMLVQTAHTDDQQTSLASEDLQIVEDQIRRMEQSINALLDFARPAPAERQHIRIRELLPDVVRLLEGQAGKQNVTLCVDEDSLDLTLNADRDQMQQLLLNLGLNALSVMPNGGRLTFSVGSHADGKACVMVSDSGPGIPDDVLPHIFEPFYTTRKQGIGLGLNICQRIAEEHGGTLHACNGTTGGAVFELCLPSVSSDSHTVVG